MSRSVYYVNPFGMIHDCLDQIQEWRRHYQQRREQQRITEAQRESQKLLARIDEIIRQTRLSELPEPTMFVDLESSTETAKQISKISEKVTRAKRIFKPEEIPLSSIMDEYIPTFNVDSYDIPEEIIEFVGREITLATRKKLYELGFEAVDEKARIFRGVIRVEHENKHTDIINVIAIGHDGLVYIIHPDKHPRNLCDAAARRLRNEVSKSIQDTVKNGLRKYFSKEGAGKAQQILDKPVREARLERETPG